MSYPLSMMLGMQHRFRRAKEREHKLRRLVERDGDHCWYCRCEFGSGKRSRTVDHFVPLCRGGTKRLENLRLACARCNALKGGDLGADFLASARLRRRRVVVQDERDIEAGRRATRRMFHHPALTWAGEWQWACSACGQTGVGPSQSPARVTCVATATSSSDPGVLVLGGLELDGLRDVGRGDRLRHGIEASRQIRRVAAEPVVEIVHAVGQEQRLGVGVAERA